MVGFKCVLRFFGHKSWMQLPTWEFQYRKRYFLGQKWRKRTSKPIVKVRKFYGTYGTWNLSLAHALEVNSAQKLHGNETQQTWPVKKTDAESIWKDMPQGFDIQLCHFTWNNSLAILWMFCHELCTYQLFSRNTHHMSPTWKHWNKKAFPNIKLLRSYHHVQDYSDRWVYLNLKNLLQFAAFEIWKRWSPSRFARGIHGFSASSLQNSSFVPGGQTGLKGWGRKQKAGHVSNEKKPGSLVYIGDYTTQVYRDYNKPL